MRNKLQSNTFSATKYPETFIDLYKFQMELDENYNKEIYVDSSDFVSLIIGSNNYYTHIKDDWQFRFKQFEQKMTMVHSMMYHNHLGTLRLLNPHMSEFIEKSLPSSPRMSQPLDVKNSDEIMGHYGLIYFTEEEKEKKAIDEMLPFERVEEEAEIRFKLMYLIDREHPKKRASHLINENIISFETETNFSIPQITDTKLFKELYRILNQLENRNHNNFIDALALCQLQNKLDLAYEEMKDEAKEVTIPLFYGRGKILEAVKEVSKDRKLITNGRFPFVFEGKSKEKHLIVQNADFFIIDALYNKSKTENQNNLTFKDFFDGIIKYYEENREGMKGAGKQKIQESTDRAVHLDFFKKWWQDTEGEKDLKKSLEKLNDFRQEELKSEEFQYISEQFEEIYKQEVAKQDLGLKYINTVFHRRFMRSLSKKHDEAGKLSYDLNHEFLTRLSYPPPSVEAIEKFIQKLYISYQIEDTEKNDELKVEMLTYLQYVLDYDVLKVVRPSERTPENKKKLEHLCVMLSILWIEGEYKLIDQFCNAIRATFEEHSTEPIENYYPNYPIALLHATSIIKLEEDNGINYKRIEKILNCVHNKFGDNNYKAWLGEAFVYAKLWESVSRKVSIPEIMSLLPPLNDIEKERRNNYYKKCSELSLNVYKKIKELQQQDRQESNRRVRHRREYYAINLHIYIETLNRSLKEFPTELENYVKDLEGVADPLLEHESYKDTIARFDQRMAAKIGIEQPENVSKYEKYTTSALERIKEAIKSCEKHNNPIDTMLSRTLKNELMRMDMEGPSYFNKCEILSAK